MATEDATAVVELTGPCPHCGGEDFVPAVPGSFLCRSCRRCWQVEDGVVRCVNPYRCERCELISLCHKPVPDLGGVVVVAVQDRGHSREKVASSATHLHEGR